MYPGAHGEFRDENVAALGEQDGCLGRDHLDLWVRLHDLLDARQRQLVKLIVVGGSLEVRDDLLPVGRENVLIRASQALVDLCPWN